MMFHVGMKVVCVDAENLGWDTGILTKGHVYTIRAVGPAQGRTHPSHRKDRSLLALWLHEVRRVKWRDESEMGFNVIRFRPLVQTDISVFQAMLSPTPVKQRESEDA